MNNTPLIPDGFTLTISPMEASFIAGSVLLMINKLMKTASPDDKSDLIGCGILSKLAALSNPQDEETDLMLQMAMERSMALSWSLMETDFCKTYEATQVVDLLM